MRRQAMDDHMTAMIVDVHPHAELLLAPPGVPDHHSDLFVCCDSALKHHQ